MMKPLHPANLMGLLARRYRQSQGWAFLAEVGNATGYGAHRHADALAIGFWPSRGLEFLGFEIKSSRPDWLRELNAPQKAEVIASFCDRWYVVAAHGDLVKDGELPPPWGLLVADGKGLREVKEAPTMSPQTPDRRFLCAILRRFADGMIPRSAISQQIEDARAQEEGRQKTTLEGLKNERDDLRKRIRDFQEAAGVPLEHWKFGRIDGIVAQLRDPVARSAIAQSLATALALATADVEQLRLALAQLNVIPLVPSAPPVAQVATGPAMSR